MRLNLWRLAIIVPLLVLLLSPGCKDCEENPANPNTNLYGTGWNSQENFSQTIPVAINYGNYQSGGALPASVDLTSYFPPVQNQGQLGTCVAWAVGYNNKTFLDGIAKKLSPSQLQSPSNQYSPTDLFFSIDQSKRSCDHGTNFDDAFNVLINRGVNTLANVPYDEICRASSPGNPSTASANRIKNFRRIQGSSKEVKEYLAQGIPVVMGAMVNREFQMWRGNGVLSNLNYTGQQGGHAMIIAGYDDSRSAFRIINSWGNDWGDNGYAWIGYSFLLDKFCIQGGQRSLFVAFNDNTTPVSPVNPPPTTSGSVDLTGMVMSDFTIYPFASPYPTARRAAFDVKNIGTQAVAASAYWNIYYLWVDAFNANNYGTIFRAEFTTAIPQNTYQNINANYSRINFNLAPGATVAQTIWGTQNIGWDYFMPAITGSYYLVLYIDKGSSNDTNQTNNVFYVTQSPKLFNNGYSQRTSTLPPVNKYQFDDILSFKHELTEDNFSKESSLAPYRKLSTAKFANAYTSEEIISFLKYKIKNGGL